MSRKITSWSSRYLDELGREKMTKSAAMLAQIAEQAAYIAELEARTPSVPVVAEVPTDDQIEKLIRQHFADGTCTPDDIALVRAVLAAHPVTHSPTETWPKWSAPDQATQLNAAMAALKRISNGTPNPAAFAADAINHIPFDNGTWKAAAEPMSAGEAPYRVAEFWSSANPDKKVRMLAEGGDIAQWPNRGDFIRWVDATPVLASEAPKPAGVLPQNWKERLYTAMDSAFALRSRNDRDAGGQQLGIRCDDTQVGVEFAMKWIESTVAPVLDSEAEGAEYRADLLALAERCGMKMTGKPNGSEPIEMVFSVQAWRKFDIATRYDAMLAAVPQLPEGNQ